MTPDGMADMTGKGESSAPPISRGFIAFRSRPAWPAKWALNLGAKVQGEAGTVRGNLVYEAK